MAFSIIATGDSVLTQRLPRHDEDCLALQKLFASFDVRFTNFELNVHDYEVAPSSVSGGTWIAASPAVIGDLRWLGLNMFAAATNHAFDWGREGLLTNRRHLQEAGCLFSGMGRNLAEAGQPAYLDTPEGRIALISVCSTAKDWHMAGEQRPDVLGAPGINVLRFNTVHYLSAEDVEALKTIAGKTDVNARRTQLEREGWIEASEGFHIDSIRFDIGKTGTVTTCNKKDVERILKTVREAERQADVVLMSHHVHEYKGTNKAVPPDFQREFARLCIDNGVHAYLGHGPHILRGIEIYKRRAILYSLGDFLLQNESVIRQPSGFFETYGLDSGATTTDGFEARSANGARGLAADRKAYESVMAAFDVWNGNAGTVELIPITMNFDKPRSRKGRPTLAAEQEGARILAELQTLCDEFQTVIEIRHGRGYITIR